MGGPILGVKSPRTSGRAGDGNARAKPKSQSLALLYPFVTNTFLALTSRCTCPLACSVVNARAMSHSTAHKSTRFTTERDRREYARCSITCACKKKVSVPSLVLGDLCTVSKQSCNLVHSL